MTHGWRGQGVCLTGNPSAATDLSLVGLVSTGGHSILLAEHPVFRDLLFGFPPFAVVSFIFFALERGPDFSGLLISSLGIWPFSGSCYHCRSWPLTGSCSFLTVLSGRRFLVTACYPR